MNPFFSIIIPIYNSEEFLEECINSVLNQNLKLFEIILINDCSTDSSLKICNYFEEKFDQVKVVNNKDNSGVSFCRNKGIKNAIGKYILFVDSDDCLIDDCLDGIYQQIEKNPKIDLVIGKYINERYDNRGDESISDDFSYPRNNKNNLDGVIPYIKNYNLFPGVCWRYAINRNFILDNNLFFISAKVYEDQEYVARLLCLAKNCFFYEDCIYLYRVRDDSLTSSLVNPNDYNNSIGALLVVCKLSKFLHLNSFSEIEKDFLYVRIRISLKTFYGHLYTNNRKNILKFSKKIDEYDQYLDNLKHLSEKFDLYYFIKTYGSYYGILLFQKLINEKTIFLLNNSNNKNIFIFCADLIGITTAKVLLNEGYKIESFLDNNEKIEGSIISKLKVNHPTIFTSYSKSEISNLFIIVCHQEDNVYNKISSQLLQFGLKQENIVQQKL